MREGSSAVVTGKAAFDLSDGSGATAPAFPESVLETVRGVDGVALAEGSVDSDSTTLIGRDGKAVVNGGAPNLGFAIAQGDSPFNPLALVEGDWPGPNEVVIDSGTAKDEDFKIGDVVGVQAEGPVERLKVSGIVRLDASISIGGATLAGFDLPTAQRLFKKVGKLDEIAVAAASGTTRQLSWSRTSRPCSRPGRRCAAARLRQRTTRRTRTSSSPSCRASCSPSPASRSSSAAS